MEVAGQAGGEGNRLNFSVLIRHRQARVVYRFPDSDLISCLGFAEPGYRRQLPVSRAGQNSEPDEHYYRHPDLTTL